MVGTTLFLIEMFSHSQNNQMHLSSF